MSDRIYTLQEIQAILSPVFSNHNVKRAVLFGSYAKGVADRKSDVDILVDSGLRGLAFFGLLEDVVTSLDKNVDLLDTAQVVPCSEVYNEIERSGVVIYGQ